MNRNELIKAITALLDRCEYRILVVIYNMLRGRLAGEA